MDGMECGYCTDQATGVDQDGEATCGGATCAPIAQPLPAVVEASQVDGESESDDAPDAYREQAP